jgi:hypothetical protein
MWDIGDICTDHHVKQIGVWITDWYYEKAPGAATGTLHYLIASLYDDNGSARGSMVNYNVNILGFNSN